MFCPECGTQIPDGARFCLNCGKSITEQPGLAQSDAGVRQASSNDQPSVGRADPLFEPPPAYVRVVPLKKSNKKPLIIAVCCAAAASAVVLIVLFAVILPNQGLAGKLRHRWLCTDGTVDTYYDFKKKVISGSGVSVPFDWRAEGEDRVLVTVNLFGISATEEYTVSFSENEKTMTLTRRGVGTVTTYVRVD